METHRNLTKLFFVFAMLASLVDSIALGTDKNAVLSSNLVKHDNNICIKQSFIKNFVEKKQTLTDEDYNNLQKCKEASDACNEHPGTISATYIEDAEEKYLILVDVYEFVKQGCWGYALQISDDISTETTYFHFDKKDDNYKTYVYIRLGFKYNFTVTPLPTGKPSSIITRAPNMCELEVIDAIYYRIQKKNLLKDCEQPDYEARRNIAKKICKKYPKSPMKRYEVTHNLLTEENCKFVLLPENSLTQINLKKYRV